MKRSVSDRLEQLVAMIEAEQRIPEIPADDMRIRDAVSALRNWMEGFDIDRVIRVRPDTGNAMHWTVWNKFGSGFWSGSTLQEAVEKAVIELRSQANGSVPSDKVVAEAERQDAELTELPM